MKLRKSAAVAAIAVLALTATACGGKEGSAGDKPSGVKPGGSEAPALPKYTVATGVDLDSPAFKKAKERGKLIIGAKADQPYLGFEDQATKERSGFDIEIAKMIAADLGFSDKQIEWKTVDSGIRETAIAKGQVDYLVGTYTINDERKKQVGFAGPYYKAGADLLVRKDESSITGKDAVKGKKVCSIVGSTPLQEIKKPEYGASVVELAKYSDCVQQLLTKQVDAVTTDDSILKGYAAANSGKLKVVGQPFTEEPYGVGLNKDDKALRDAINTSLENHTKDGTYKKIYEATLGLSGSAYTEPPAIERY
ncbi:MULTISPECIES: glutamate ABC transporter substrate-binding protein [unclassified Streptomyces]|uniref:glutamate ABC transporter substrate-binding protein n=1 Tax=Streptomyces TaxID=1883 RepID=UPI0001C1987D|nr:MULTISPECIES: glutamate ABC transporter substrate-binding protein [unclassified Streptomyces]AEN12771.1 extracellular solute-binding protein family 3 [Streptomyces sp. SirexAA-E]MYR66227.1 transporter substrate-binding domain-containing protein [Streptomyces sp. SID4939]MYS00701.1 transporter substrate-binding domain-containing protein [Streptomyces sp. SID4940]MYT65642.1 transporter substrate-binding domain-containing protein [Streptomyces sp. SID8357]MYT84322.1 transporter substrate-bindi